MNMSSIEELLESFEGRLKWYELHLGSKEKPFQYWGFKIKIGKLFFILT